VEFNLIPDAKIRKRRPAASASAGLAESAEPLISLPSAVAGHSGSLLATKARKTVSRKSSSSSSACAPDDGDDAEDESISSTAASMNDDGRAGIYVASFHFHSCTMYICIHLGTFFLF
jgi:hypothetical protein